MTPPAHTHGRSGQERTGAQLADCCPLRAAIGGVRAAPHTASTTQAATQTLLDAVES